MTPKFIRSLAILGVCAALAAPASARDFVAYASTTPMLYRYASCVFEGDMPTAEAQIDKCAELKLEMEQEAAEAIQRFHVIERRDVQFELARGFREIELDARQTRRKNKPVPNAIVGYLRCMGEGAMADPEFRAGDAISYLGVQDRCEETYVDPSKGAVSGKEEISIRALYLRFQRNGRLTFPAARQAVRRQRSGLRLPLKQVMDRSFLNIGLIKRVSID